MEHKNDVLSVDDRDELLKKLACFGCKYADDCLNDFEKGAQQCESMYSEALDFVQDNLDR